MLSSKKGNDLQYLDNTTLKKLNSTCNGVPKITSTPLNTQKFKSGTRSNSVLLSPTKTHLGTPRRYSLSEITSPLNKLKHGTQSTHSPGPLLASLNYRDNVSMYEETKSSGLASRIVMYNEETEEQQKHPPTHQERYNSIGLFPIVHLFKKNPPCLEKSPKRVKIKLSSPDYLKHSPQPQSRLLEEITKPRFPSRHSLSSCSQSSNDTGTKSVLEALKEISRKRIHSNEGYDTNEESGKRLRTELPNGSTTTSKRLREVSPLLDSSQSPSPKQTSKRTCVYDEYAASKSSSDFSFLNRSEPLRAKRKTISTSTESLKESKQVKLVSVETQTLPPPEEKTKVTETNTDDADGKNSKKKDSPVKVFRDAPLDKIRKNRLAALMGNLAGKEASLPTTSPEDTVKDQLKEPETQRETTEKPVESAIVSKPEYVPPSNNKETENRASTDAIDKSVISILSPPKTSETSTKPDKHVQFNTQQSMEAPSSQSSVITQFPGQTNVSSSSNVISSDSIKNTFASITPAVSDTSKSPSTTTFSFVAPNKSDLNKVGNPGSTLSSSSKPSFSFGTQKNDQISNNSLNLFNKDANAESKNSTTTPSFPTTVQFAKPSEQPSVPKINFEAPNAGSPSKMGGFKFDLKTSSSGLNTNSPNKSDSALGSSSSLNSGASVTSTASSVVSSSFVFGKPAETNKNNSFNFGVVSSNSVTTSNTSGTSSIATSSSASATPSFNFGGPLTRSPSFNFAGKLTPATSAIQPTTASSTFSFGSNEKTTAAPAFGTTPTFVTSTTSSTPLFGTPSVSSGFGSANAFGASTTTSNTFEVNKIQSSNITTTSAPVFGFGGNIPVTSTSMFSGAKPALNFGNSNSSVPAPAPSMFGNPVTTAVGFSSANAGTVFGSNVSNPTPAFGVVPSQSATPFGASTTTTSSSAFVVAPTTTVSAFGQTPSTTPSVFGGNTTAAMVPNATIAFGTTIPTTTSGFGSGTGVTNAFGAPQNTQTSQFGGNVFGKTNTQTPVFGNSSFNSPNPTKSVFGQPVATSAVVPTFGTPITTSSNFGTGVANSTFSFGSNKPTTNVFGSTTTTTSVTFGGGAAATTFSSPGTTSGFGNSAPAFGSPAVTTSNAFGASKVPSFGQADNKPAFSFGSTAESKATSVFGSGPGNSAFGKPVSSSGFGSSTGGFGAPANNNNFGNQPTTQNSGGFNFNASSGPASGATAPFVFGASKTDPPKPNFNFTGGAANPPAFGTSNSTPSFGSPAVPNFGAPSPVFGATGSPAGVFNIGAGSASSGRPRNQLRAKRRT